MAGETECPFCALKIGDSYELLFHIETNHNEGPSPFVTEDDRRAAVSNAAKNDTFVRCPYNGCGEYVIDAELEAHLNLHEKTVYKSGDNSGHSRTARGRERDEYVSPYPSRNEDDSSRSKIKNQRPNTKGKPSQLRVIESWRQIFRGSPSKTSQPELSASDGARTKNRRSDGPGAVDRYRRLGKDELGRFANEDKMPIWLVSLLKREGQVVAKDVIPVVQELLRQCPRTSYAYLCHPCVQHISKLKHEGGFCGYRNIQMLSTYITGSTSTGFPGPGFPSIFQIQDWIEDAWDNGINSSGRVETGGIKGTRKYIGTPEAQAMFLGQRYPCTAQGFKCKEPGRAEFDLMQHAEQYFAEAYLRNRDGDMPAKIRGTLAPPIFFQHRGHSMTIVGFEKKNSGRSNLLVFDPMSQDNSSIRNIIGKTVHVHDGDYSLSSYRRGNDYLGKFSEFEILMLTPDEDESLLY